MRDFIQEMDKLRKLHDTYNQHDEQSVICSCGKIFDRNANVRNNVKIFEQNRDIPVEEVFEYMLKTNEPDKNYYLILQYLLSEYPSNIKKCLEKLIKYKKMSWNEASLYLNILEDNMEEIYNKIYNNINNKDKKYILDYIRSNLGITSEEFQRKFLKKHQSFSIKNLSNVPIKILQETIKRTTRFVEEELTEEIDYEKYKETAYCLHKMGCEIRIRRICDKQWEKIIKQKDRLIANLANKEKEFKDGIKAKRIEQSLKKR